MTFKLRLLLTVLCTVFIAIVMASGLSLYRAVSESTVALEQAAQEILTVENTQTAEAIEGYFSTIESQIRVKSSEPYIVKAAKAFIPAFNQYESQRSTLTNSEHSTLERYYTKDFAGLYQNRNNKAASDVTSLHSDLSDNAKSLQHDFIAGSRFPIGEKDNLTELGNDTDYARLHAQYHPSIRRFLKEFGYYDIFIADISTGNIVYSVYKELDYATSLKSGPYANTGIGYAFQQALKAIKPDAVIFSELTPYLPSYDALAGFVSSPIYDNGQAVAVLIFQAPLDRINTIVTHSQEWKQRGFGDSGETYLVNPNGMLLSESRFFLETPNDYFTAVGNKYSDVAEKAKASGTTIGVQPVNTATAQAALKGKTGFDVVLDYRDVPVFSAYSPITIGNFTYALLAEIDEEEALRPATKLSASLTNASIVLGVIILAIGAVVAIVVAKILVSPIEKLGDTCESLNSGEGDLSIKLASSNIPEIDRVINAFNQFIGQIRDLVAQVKEDSNGIASASEQLSVVTKQSERSLIQQRDQTHVVATAMEELSSSIAEVAQSTITTRDFSVKAKESLTENLERADLAAKNIKLLVELIQHSNEVILSLKEEVNQITSVLNVITSIADQTNLLALNAAIEAARAGEAGRGFSVVADEVRTLATRSQENTVEISKIVEKMTASSERSVDAMERASVAAKGGIHLVDLVTHAMNGLSDTIDKVQDMTNSVATATTEQHQTSDSVSQNIMQISDMSEDVEQGAAQTSSATANLAKIAAQAKAIVERFKV